MANHRKGWEEPRKVESFDGFCVTKSTFQAWLLPHAPSSGEHGRRWYLVAIMDNGWSLSEN